MILFKKLRMKASGDNRFGKYLKYAFGETVLLVIGILIALQVNNYNAERKEKKAELSYLQNLKRDLQEQIKTIDQQTAYEEKFVRSAALLDTYFNNRILPEPDSAFFHHLAVLHGRKTFIINDPTYTELIASGNITLISNQRFRDEMIRYYQEMKRIERVIQNNNIYLVDQQYGPVPLQIGYFYENTLEEARFPVSDSSSAQMAVYHQQFAGVSAELLQDPKNSLLVFNMIHMRYTICLANVGIMKKLRQQTQELLESLDKISG